MIAQRTRIAVLLAAGLPLLAPCAWADTPKPPEDYSVASADERYLFVMLADEPTMGLLKGRPLRPRYSRSGLYPNDGSSVPLWTVDWYAHHVIVMSDGRHLVRWGGWPDRGNYGALALAFLTDGKETRRYTVRELVRHPSQLPHSVSHYSWLAEQSVSADESRLTVRTQAGEVYVFAVATGEVLKRSPWWRFLWR